MENEIDETIDEISFADLKIIQKQKGYRFSIDALLLVEFCKIKKGERVIDLGTGSGVIAQILAKTTDLEAIVGLELQETMLEMAARSVKINRLEEKVTLRHGDIRKVKEIFKAGEFDVAVCNPPYRRVGAGRINPRTEKAIARHELEVKIEDVIKASAYLLKKPGRFYLIYLSERLAELFSLLTKYRLEPKRLRCVYHTSNAESEMVLVEAVSDGGRGMKIEPPLVLKGEEDKKTRR
ncbi:MAG: methyltransferase domain-containing protein [bacterium]